MDKFNHYFNNTLRDYLKYPETYKIIFNGNINTKSK
jgi:hypothetical protein